MEPQYDKSQEPTNYTPARTYRIKSSHMIAAALLFGVTYIICVGEGIYSFSMGQLLIV